MFSVSSPQTTLHHGLYMPAPQLRFRRLRRSKHNRTRQALAKRDGQSAKGLRMRQRPGRGKRPTDWLQESCEQLDATCTKAPCASVSVTAADPAWIQKTYAVRRLRKSAAVSSGPPPRTRLAQTLEGTVPLKGGNRATDRSPTYALARVALGGRRLRPLHSTNLFISTCERFAKGPVIRGEVNDHGNGGESAEPWGETTWPIRVPCPDFRREPRCAVPPHAKTAKSLGRRCGQPDAN